MAIQRIKTKQFFKSVKYLTIYILLTSKTQYKFIYTYALKIIIKNPCVFYIFIVFLHSYNIFYNRPCTLYIIVHVLGIL